MELVRNIFRRKYFEYFSIVIQLGILYDPVHKTKQRLKTFLKLSHKDLRLTFMFLTASVIDIAYWKKIKHRPLKAKTICRNNNH